MISGSFGHERQHSLKKVVGSDLILMLRIARCSPSVLRPSPGDTHILSGTENEPGE
jgi:hypothetical protein